MAVALEPRHARLRALAANYGQMLAARFLVGVGEAAYGSVGIAVVLSVFAPRVTPHWPVRSWPAARSAR